MSASDEPSDDRIAFVLARVNAGLRKEWSQIGELAASLEQTLKDARALGESHVSGHRRADWDRAWRDLRAEFESIRTSDAEAQRRFTSEHASADPLEPWCDVLAHEESFTNALTEIRNIGAECIPPGDRTIWEDMCDQIEGRVGTIEAHASAIRFQLELRAKYGTEKANALTKEVAARLPRDVDLSDAKKYAAEYRKAWQDFEREKETVGGVWDVLKSLMLVQPKTPSERLAEKPPQHLQPRPA
jgi:hypothetical protein